MLKLSSLLNPYDTDISNMLPLGFFNKKTSITSPVKSKSPKKSENVYESDKKLVNKLVNVPKSVNIFLNKVNIPKKPKTVNVTHIHKEIVDLVDHIIKSKNLRKTGRIPAKKYYTAHGKKALGDRCDIANTGKISCLVMEKNKPKWRKCTKKLTKSHKKCGRCAKRCKNTIVY